MLNIPNKKKKKKKKKQKSDSRLGSGCTEQRLYDPQL